MFRRILWWLPAVTWAFFIFFLSTLKAGTRPPPWILSNDKVVHAVLFGTLAALIYVAARRGQHWSVGAAAAVGAIASALYGATDEVHQLWTPSRVADVMDWVADAAGAALAVSLAALFSRLFRAPTR